MESWVAEFADEQLRTLIEQSLAGNFDLKAAAARFVAARAQARIDGSGRWPQLSFAPGYQRAQVRDSGFGASQFGAFEAMFNLSWELDVWGRIKAGRDASLADASAAEDDWRAARLSLAARVAQRYFDLVEAQLQTGVAEQSIRDRRTVVDLVRGRFNRGLTTGLDLRLALTDLANAEAQLADSRNRVQLVARELEVMMGRYPGARLTAPVALPEPPGKLSAGLPSELLARRPDLKAALLRLNASELRVESANKALLPRITLTGSGGTRSPALMDLADPRAAAWNLAMGLTQPLFTGGRLKGQIELEQGKADEAFFAYRQLALNAFREVEQALASEERLRDQERSLREAVRQTEESRKLAVYSYRHGLIEILTLLDSYRSTLNAQSSHLSVRRQLLNNRIELYLALGGSA